MSLPGIPPYAEIMLSLHGPTWNTLRKIVGHVVRVETERLFVSLAGCADYEPARAGVRTVLSRIPSGAPLTTAAPSAFLRDVTLRKAERVQAACNTLDRMCEELAPHVLDELREVRRWADAAWRYAHDRFEEVTPQR